MTSQNSLNLYNIDALLMEFCKFLDLKMVNSALSTMVLSILGGKIYSLCGLDENYTIVVINARLLLPICVSCAYILDEHFGYWNLINFGLLTDIESIE